MKKVMKMNIKQLLVVALAVMTAGGAAAQDGERTLERQVDVSREYAPEMKQAVKLGVVPNMTDTVSLRPQYDYSIFPKAWSTGFGVEAINPVQLYASDFARRYPFYVKLGGGFPGQSLFDLYGASTGGRKGSFGGYINHYGQYGKGRNDTGRKVDNGHMTNSVGVFGSLHTGKRTTLSGELGYDYDTWKRYGQMPLDPSWPSPGMSTDTEKITTAKYSVPHAKLVFGNDFRNLSLLNFRVGAQGYHLADDDDNKEAGIEGYAEVAKRFSVHNVGLKASVEYVKLKNDKRPYEATKNKFTLSPRYGIMTGNFSVDMAADFIYDKHSDDKALPSGNSHEDFVVLPQARITFNIADGAIVPFAELSSRLECNSYYDLVRENPYLSPGNIGLTESGKVYDFRVGAFGAIGSNVGYRLYAGYSIEKDVLVPVSILGYAADGATLQTTTSNMAGVDKVNYFMIGGELETRFAGSFTAVLDAHYYSYTTKPGGVGFFGKDKFSFAFGRPDYDASLSVRYNCRDKFFAGARAKLLGERHFIDAGMYMIGVPNPEKDVKVDPVVDMSLDAEYFFKPQLGVFVSATNLLGSKLYYHNHYKDNGPRVNAGVKLLF